MTTHHHSHNHDHHHGTVNYNRAFAWGAAFNLAFVVVEAIYGYLSHSLALLADAGHNFSDVIGLLLAWAAAWLSTRKPSSLFTYGWGQSSILAALANAVLLLAAVGAILWEAIQRLSAPLPLSPTPVIVVAGIGIVINTATALLFMSGRKTDINIRGAYLHMAADALVSAAVVIAGLLMQATNWFWLDPLMSLIVGAIVLFSTWGLLRDSLRMAVAGVPPGIHFDEVKKFISEIKGIDSIHDLHIWPMSTTETALTAHLVMRAGHPGDRFLKQLSHDLEHRFQISHSTFQIEMGDDEVTCQLHP